MIFLKDFPLFYFYEKPIENFRGKNTRLPASGNESFYTHLDKTHDNCLIYWAHKSDGPRPVEP